MTTSLRDFKGVSDDGLGVMFKPDPEQVLADAHLGHGVKLQLVRDNDSETWEVWAVEVDGVVYREPRDLTGEPLEPGKFASALASAEASGRQFLDG